MATKTKSHNKYNKRKKNKKNVEHNKNKNINNNNNNNNNNNDNNNIYKCIKISNYNIKVGEHEFCLTSESLNHDAPNFFTAAFFGYFSEAETTSIFIERDPTYFGMIVRYLRGYQVNWPINDKVSMDNLISDAKFYSFEKLQNLLEELYDKSFPEKVIPWKILTYAPENDPVVVINIKDVELSRWNSRSLVYDTNPISKINEKNGDDNNDGNDNDNDGNDNGNDNDSDVDNDVDNVDGDVDGNNDDDDNANDNETDNAAADDNVVDNNDNDNDNGNDNDNAANNDLEEPNAEKGLHRLEIHGRDALATVTSNHNNGIKFENFTLKNSAEEETFRVLTESFRTSEGCLTLSPSLKLPYLKDSCIEIDGSKYYTYKDLSDYFGVTSRGKQLYFEEIVLRIVDGAFLMRARAFTIPHYYASQPII